jgi:multiple antibiotic resistance protein
MDISLAQFALTAFVTLLVVVDPVGVAPLFVAVTREMPTEARRRTLRRAIAIAALVALFFLLAGQFLLAHLGVSVHAFAISGGVLLFATALPMLFGHRPVLQGPERGDMRAAADDPAVFPLAIPLMSGPGTIATVLLFANQARGEPLAVGVLLAVCALVFALTWAVLHAAQRLLALLGEGGINILTRVLGLVLSALAVQYVLDGLTGYYETLVTR